MDEAETRLEVQRLLGGAKGNADSDSPYSLFPRVHKALLRQMKSGKLKVK